MSADNPKFSDGTPIFPNRGSAEPAAPSLRDKLALLVMKSDVQMLKSVDLVSRVEVERLQYDLANAVRELLAVVRAPQGDPPDAMTDLLRRIEALTDDQAAYLLDVWSGEIPGNWRQQLFLDLTTEAERYEGALRRVPAPQGDAPPQSGKVRRDLLDAYQSACESGLDSHAAFECAVEEAIPADAAGFSGGASSSGSAPPPDSAARLAFVQGLCRKVGVRADDDNLSNLALNLAEEIAKLRGASPQPPREET